MDRKNVHQDGRNFPPREGKVERNQVINTFVPDSI
jgi:hypothetical protein